MQNKLKEKLMGQKKQMVIISLMMIIFFNNILFSQTEYNLTEIDQKTIIELDAISDGADKVIIAQPLESFDRADLRVYERIDNVWILRYNTEGFFGRNGVKMDKEEGDGATPLGVFTFGRAFGIAENPGSILTYTQVSENDVWVDDVNSKYYNQWSFLDNPDLDWSSAEHLINYPIQYKYVLSINYNTNPIIPGKGSAIFLHCSADRPTAGCIAVSEEAMLFFLGFVDENTKIGIFMDN